MILVHPTRPGRIWVAISAAGVFRSDDGGASWTVCNEGLYPVPTGESRTNGDRLTVLQAVSGGR